MHILSFIHITQNSQAALFCDAKILNWRFPRLKKSEFEGTGPIPHKTKKRWYDYKIKCGNLANFFEFMKKNAFIYCCKLVPYYPWYKIYIYIYMYKRVRKQILFIIFLFF